MTTDCYFPHHEYGVDVLVDMDVCLHPVSPEGASDKCDARHNAPQPREERHAGRGIAPSYSIGWGIRYISGRDVSLRKVEGASLDVAAPWSKR